jgi:hypothetical protein
MPFVVKAVLEPDARAEPLSFTEKTVYRGKEIRIHDEIFVFASDHHGRQGLCARGVVTSVARGPDIRVSIKVRPIAKCDTEARKIGTEGLS